jgi:phosphoglucosamine mutase
VGHWLPSFQPMGNLFGTDGIRGNADHSLTPDLVREVGRAVAVWAGAGARIILGRDTRVSGPALEESFVDGACSAGADVLLGGVLPTAAVAYLTTLLDGDAGIVISASHNPPSDNGIKFFSRGGWKLNTETESTIEALVGSDESGSGEGGVHEIPEAVDSYIAHIDAVASHNVRGLRVVVDCANGAASAVAPEALRRIGVDVTAINDSLDGSLINEGCGALHPEVITNASKEVGAIGLTFDGDADRVLLSDENGRLVDGDAILAIMAKELKDEGRLASDAIVATVMANQALRRWCESEGIKIVETPVGDRHVLEALRHHDLVLGGEQSGHIIRLDQATTGDGILAGIAVLDAVAATGRPLSDLVPFEPFPQVLVNVETKDREQTEASEVVRSAVADAERRLGPDGRVLVRPSGTEPLVRVMVEAPEASLAKEIAEQVAGVVREQAGGDF